MGRARRKNTSTRPPKPVLSWVNVPPGKLDDRSEARSERTLAQIQGSAPTTAAPTPTASLGSQRRTWARWRTRAATTISPAGTA